MNKQILGGVIVLFALASLTEALVSQAQSSAPGFISIQSPVSVHRVTNDQLAVTGTAGGGKGVVNDCPTTPRTFVWERGELESPADWRITPEGGSTVLLSGTFVLNQLGGEHPPQECGNGTLGQNFTYDFGFNVSVATLTAGRYLFTAETTNADFGNRVSDTFVFEIGAAPAPMLETSINSPAMTFMSDANKGSATFLVRNVGDSGSEMDWRSRVAFADQDWLKLGSGTTSSQGLRPEDGWVSVTVFADPPPFDPDRQPPLLDFGQNVGQITIECVNHDPFGPSCQEPQSRIVEPLYNIDLQVWLGAPPPAP